MSFFEYLYYRMYNAYTEKNDSPLFRTFMYMALVQFVLVVVLIIFIEKFLVIGGVFSDKSIVEVKRSYMFWATIFLSIFIITYFGFSRKGIPYYEARFDKCYSLNRTVRIWMLVVLPFMFLFLSINIFILLFGGTIFGKEIIGILYN